MVFNKAYHNHTFRVVKKLGREDYEELSIEEKEKLWKRNVSGSMVKNVLQQPKTTFLIKMGYIKEIKVGKSPLEKVIPGFNRKSVEKTFWGNHLEEQILEGVNKFYYQNLDGKEIKFDKRTFRSNWKERITANIDGYTIQDRKTSTFTKNAPDIENIDMIIENKNMEAKGATEQDYNNILDVAMHRYEYQIRFYMWFFNAKRALLNVLINGYKIKQVIYPRNKEKEDEILDKVSRFLNIIDYYETNLATGSDEYETLDECLAFLDWTDGEAELGADFNALKLYLQFKEPYGNFILKDIEKIKLLVYKYFKKEE